jgi:GTP-binding protein HflX
LAETPSAAQPEPAVLVAVQLPTVSEEETNESLSELAALARTAGAEVMARLTQKRSSFDPATLLGRGKIEEVERAVAETGASLVIFDNDLTVGQLDRLGSMIDARVTDRTALILDIFALHAHTSEGRTQVELAQLSYLLPRIRGRGTELSRIGGGIGTRRGKGETQLEVDRRRIRRRMRKLEHDIEQMEAVRLTQRKKRTRAGVPSVCLVGYTNSGKSSLLNRLTGADVLVEDQLFSTLDSTTRRLGLPDGRAAVLSDTVGFIRKLPHELVAAFHSTLEVAQDAELLVHVVDATRQETMEERMQAVSDVLTELGAAEIPSLVAFNKVDRLEPIARIIMSERYPAAIKVSAATGEGTSELLEAIAGCVSNVLSMTLRIPASRGDLIAGLYRDGTVLESRADGEVMIMTARIPSGRTGAYRAFLADDRE